MRAEAGEGYERRDGISDWALAQFQAHYGDPSITKEAIFYYIYAMLHHPEYRTRYAANLKRELPRVPFALSQPSPEGQGLRASAGLLPPSPLGGRAGDEGERAGDEGQNAFHALAALGRALADLHLGYESAPEYPLRRRENPAVPPSLRVEKLRLSKDKASITVNDFLTLEGIPPEAYEYRLGNRSALEWVIDQYQVKTDARSGICNDPNRLDDEGYIVRLIGQVIHVSLETQRLVAEISAYRWA